MEADAGCREEGLAAVVAWKAVQERECTEKGGDGGVLGLK